MGVSVGAALLAGGSDVFWASAGRSRATIERARTRDFSDCGTLQKLVANVSVIISVCPPHAALAMADEVRSEGFHGLFVDANAISPTTALQVEETMIRAGARYVDGGIVGPPPDVGGSTRLYLSGADADAIVGLFASSLIEAICIGPRSGAASALKMCYAAYTKGSDALLLAIRALASAEGVDDVLRSEWQRSQPEVHARSERAAAGSAPKAWRFEREMREVAASMLVHDLPAGFHESAAELYKVLSVFKDEDSPSVEAVIRQLLGRPQQG